MFVTFFHELKSAGVPVTLREYLTLMEAMQADLAGRRVQDFYYLSRATLIKDERNLDKFDRVFGHVFKGLELLSDGIEASIPGMAEKAGREIPDRRGEEADRGNGRPRQAARDLAQAPGRTERAAIRAAASGSAPADLPFGNAGYNPKASASARKQSTAAP